MEPLLNDPLYHRDEPTIEDIIEPGACELPDHKWFVLRVTYGRAQKAEEIILQSGTLAFLPTECKCTIVKGRRFWKKVPCTRSFVFAYGTFEQVHALTHRSIEKTRIPFVDFAFDHTAKESNGKDKIMTVPFSEMQNFIRVVLASMPESYSVTPQEIHYRPGGLVLVKEGPFKGVVGRVARVHSQQRVVVSIPRVIDYVTTYIPKAWIEPVE